ncbi:sacsin-like [Mytilus galloprovincialis]|uniref:sacsin-like n=1 Tax=Mytilus galloprovincialis TaxID=29158 RepID=UPI003F7C4402
MASMTSMDDQETKQGGTWVTMDQPPLLKLLQNILREYPKDAQIFHELVQNAEDAEATLMKILFIPETSTSSPPEFEKYFQSPGVCVYNDALSMKWIGKILDQCVLVTRRRRKTKLGNMDKDSNPFFI